MTNVTQIRRFHSNPEQRIYHHQLQHKAADSWWVFRSCREADGSVSPFGRVVFFARTREQAESWIAAQQPNPTIELALSA